MRCMALGLALWLSFGSIAHADWADDISEIRRLVARGEHAAAEQFAGESLKRGPGGFLFAGTGTLQIQYWRGRLRLLLGNLPGAIEDADAIIKADSSFMPPDTGYVLISTEF